MLETIIGSIIGSFGTLSGVLISYRLTARRQRENARIAQLSLAFSDLFRYYTEYFTDQSDHAYGVLLSCVERVRLFCSDDALPAVDAFRTALLSLPRGSSELGVPYRALVDLSRSEVRR